MENDKESLERFILSNPELEKLEGMISDFNLFETLNLIHAEIRHSNVLSWLLNPSQNHGLGSYFLNLFLKHFISENKSTIEGIDIFKIEMLSYTDVEVRREWKNIDILIIIKEKDENLVIAIENKVKSAEHSDQLVRYREIVEKEFADYEQLFVYLTPEPLLPSDENWVNFNYGTIASLIAATLTNKRNQLNETIYAFIDQYNQILKKHIVGNSEIEKIAKQIYQKHKNALDIIFQYKPDMASDISDYLQSLIHENAHLIFDSAGKTLIRFTTPAIDSMVPKVSQGWLRSRRMMVYEFHNYDNKLMLRLYIGPGEKDLRKLLFDFFGKKPGVFPLTKYTMGSKHHCVYQKEFLRKTEYEQKEYEDLVLIINKKWKEFIENQLPQIDAYIKTLPVDLARFKSDG